MRVYVILTVSHKQLKNQTIFIYEETEPEVIRTDTETEQESVKTKWRKIRLRGKALRLFSRNYQILIEEVTNTFKTFASLYYC